MDTEQFLQSVELLAGLNRDSARRAVQATLATWPSASAGRSPPRRPEDSQVSWGRRGTGGPDAAEPFDAEEFARRTAAREDVDHLISQVGAPGSGSGTTCR